MMDTYAFKIIADRKPEIRGARPREYALQRLAQAAENLSRAGRAAARVEVANEALCRLTELAYEVDPDGELVNVDRLTYRLLIGAPWGSTGWAAWGLRRWEARALSAVLRARQEAFRPGAGRPPLYIYDPATRYWYLNYGDYGSLQVAGWWLKKSAITLKEWRKYAG